MLINKHCFEDQPVVVPTMEAKGIECPLKHISYEGKVIGPLFKINIKQVFQIGNGEGPIEAIYSFPYPYNSVVHGLTVKFGDNLLQGSLKPKETAKQEYEKAKEEGKQASLLVKSDPTLLSLSVNGIIPNQTVEVNTVISGIATYRFGYFILTLPTTRISSPYGNGIQEGIEGKVPYAKTSISENQEYKASINLSFQKAEMIDGEAGFRRSGDKFKYKQEDIIPDKDFFIRWLPETNDKEANKLYIFKERTQTNTKAFVGLIVPKPVETEESVEVLIAVDHSGSMGGEKLKVADATSLRIIRELRPDDLFNICVFSGSCIWLSEKSIKATEGNKEWAKTLLEHNEGGGTDTAQVLDSASKMPKQTDHSSLIVITDGEVYENSFKDKDLDTRAIHIVSVGATANQYFIHEVAGKSGGEAICILEESNFEKSIDSVAKIIRASSTEEPPIVKVNKEQVKWFDCRYIPTHRPYVISGILESEGAGLKLTSAKESKWKIEQYEADDISILPIVGGMIVSKMESNRETKASDLVDVSLNFGVISKEVSLVLVGEKIPQGKAGHRTIEVALSKSARFYSPMHTSQNLTRSVRSKGGSTRGAGGQGGSVQLCGFAGPSGSTGSQGYCGSSGFSGCSGFSGFSGAAGTVTPQYTLPQKEEDKAVLVITRGTNRILQLRGGYDGENRIEVNKIRDILIELSPDDYAILYLANDRVSFLLNFVGKKLTFKDITKIAHLVLFSRMGAKMVLRK